MGVSFDKILVVGIGLIGGSILKTIKELNLSFEVYGVDQNEEVTTHAHNLGLIKNRSNDLEKINEDCLIIFSRFNGSRSLLSSFPGITFSYDQNSILY